MEFFDNISSVTNYQWLKIIRSGIAAAGRINFGSPFDSIDEKYDEEILSNIFMYVPINFSFGLIWYSY